MTFHSGEQNELDDITKLKIVQPIKNHALELQHNKIEPNTSQ